MNSELMTRADSAMIEKVVVGGDLGALAPAERLSYYSAVCESLGLNPLTKPFDYIRLNNKLTLYAKRDCTDQLRDKRKINITIQSREKIDDVYIVTAKATMPDGRTDESIGAVSINGLKGDALANALMKCETKAKRRVTLSIVGLGWLDETEIETIPDARPEIISIETGEVAPAPKANGKTNGPRPMLSPDKLREVLKKKVETSNLKDSETGQYLPINLHPFGPKTAQIVASRFQYAFQMMDTEDTPESPEAMYKTCLPWLTGHISANDLSAAWADVLLDWLCNGNKGDKFKAAIVAPAMAEALALYERVTAEEKANEVADSILDEQMPWWDQEMPEMAETEKPF